MGTLTLSTSAGCYYYAEDINLVEWSVEFEKKEPLPISLFEMPVLLGKE